MNKDNITEFKKINFLMIIKDLFVIYIYSTFIICLLIFLAEHGYLGGLIEINYTIENKEFWNVVYILYISVITAWIIKNVFNIAFLHVSKYIKQGEQIVWKK